MLTERTKAASDCAEEGRRGAVDHLDRDRHDPPVQDQRAEPEGEHREREDDSDQERPDERVDRRDQASGQEGRFKARKVDAGDQPDHGPEDDGDERPEDEPANHGPGAR